MCIRDRHAGLHLRCLLLLGFNFFDALLHLLDDLCLTLTVLSKFVELDGLLVESCQLFAFLQEADLLQESLVLGSLGLAASFEAHHYVEVLLAQC